LTNRNGFLEDFGNTACVSAEWENRLAK